jgi:homoserine dehydrogenase
MGYGVVGGGVAEMLMRGQTQRVSKMLPDALTLAAVLDIREVPDAPCAGLFIKDFALIEQNPEIRIVAETIGGTRAAFDFTKRALNAGKHVVTSNKELVAAHGAELLALAEKKGVNYLFEASVGGGIPLIRPISHCLAANRISEVCGILNGTTNYILTRMHENGLSMLEALDEARAKGYAEADPSDDIEGKDACRKISILASLAFGRHMYPNFVPTQGISYISRKHMEEAARAGGEIKLIARARAAGEKTDILVAPHVVDNGHPLAGVRGVNNAVLVRGDASGDVMFYGRGAGRMPTASAVMADIIHCALHINENTFPGWEDSSNDLTVELPGTELIRFSDGTAMRRLRKSAPPEQAE